MHNAYIYPISARYQGQSKNPYLDNFMDSLEEQFHFVNRHAPSGSGILDLMHYFHKIHYVFLHWPENIAEKKMGVLQTLIFLYIFIPYMKIRKIKIVYVVHNKLSHTQNRIRLKKLIARRLLKKSTIIITHAREGIDFVHSIVKAQKPVFFFPHPVDKPLLDNTHPEKEIDILIWGNIAPYKGIDRFLKLLQVNNTENWKVVIAGRVSSEDYMHELNALKPDNVKIINEFLDDIRIEQLIAQSRIVLFPYHQESVLSSGVFAKTMAFPVHIIGPACGAFNDFVEYENIHTFIREEEIIQLIAARLEFSTPDFDNIDKNIKCIEDAYAWESFGKAFIDYLEN